MKHTKAELNKQAQALKTDILFVNSTGEIFTEQNRALLSEGNDPKKIHTHKYEPLVEVAVNTELATNAQLSNNAADETGKNVVVPPVVTGKVKGKGGASAPKTTKGTAKADVIPAKTETTVVPVPPVGSQTPAIVAGTAKEIVVDAANMSAEELAAAAKIVNGETGESEKGEGQ